MWIIYLYNFLNILLVPGYLIMFIIRILQKKENIRSIIQRLCLDMPKRPKGELLWIHAASVGETNLALNLIEMLKKKHTKINFLLTTGTITSKNIIKNNNDKKIIHQFLPIDNFFTIKSFLWHWRPKNAIFIESEFWPALITETAKKCELLLVNARLSDNSFRRWQKFNKLFQIMAKSFKQILVQSKNDLEKYKNLGCDNIELLGNLKFTNKILPVDYSYLKKIKKILSQQQIFVAASTHKHDEEVVLQIINKLKQNNQLNFYPIIIPRHPIRVKEITNKCNKLKLTYDIKSASSLPDINKDLYIVDSFGELGIFYSLADIVFIGGSFSQNIGGHNLLEAAYFDNLIIVGPNMNNFQNITDEMLENESIIQINSKKDFSEKLAKFFDEQEKIYIKKYSKNSKKFVQERQKILNNYLNIIDKYLI